MNITKDAWNPEWRVFDTFKFLEHSLIDSKLLDIVNAIRICLTHNLCVLDPCIVIVSPCFSRCLLDVLECTLHVFSQINIIREVKCFFSLDLFNHLDVWLVLRWNIEASIRAKRNILQLVNTIHYGANVVSYDSCCLD